jgi:hypothetical protein
MTERDRPPCIDGDDPCEDCSETASHCDLCPHNPWSHDGADELDEERHGKL